MNNLEPSTRPAVLVSAGSKHGSTAEIAERIAGVLSSHDLDVTVCEPDRVDGLEGYSAIVLGSAVYTGHWLPAVKDLAARVALLRPKPHVWLFSSGPLGDPPKPEGDPIDVIDVEIATSARGHRVFGGKIDKSQLSFGEKVVVNAVRAPEGDYRVWDDIDDWAGEIAHLLQTALAGDITPA